MIFVNVSGLNAISTGTRLFQGPIESVNISDSIKALRKANILPFTKELSWWPDIELLNTIKKQDSTINYLIQRSSKFMPSSVIYADYITYPFLKDSMRTLVSFENQQHIISNARGEHKPLINDRIIYNGQKYQMQIDSIITFVYDSILSIRAGGFRIYDEADKKVIFLGSLRSLSNKSSKRSDKESLKIFYNFGGRFNELQITLDSMKPRLINITLGKWTKTYYVDYNSGRFTSLSKPFRQRHRK